jgi:hypothetical protein
MVNVFFYNIINAPITIDEIKSAMENLKNNKASGEDLIVNEYLKHAFEIMSDIYVKLFNLIFDTIFFWISRS